MTDRAMPEPGPAMDALVRDAIGNPPHTGQPSVFSEAAMFALEAWLEQNPDWTGQIILPYGEHRYYEVQLWPVPERYGDGWECLAKSKMLAQAICAAIIRAHWALEGAG